MESERRVEQNAILDVPGGVNFGGGNDDLDEENMPDVPHQAGAPVVPETSWPSVGGCWRSQHRRWDLKSSREVALAWECEPAI